MAGPASASDGQASLPLRHTGSCCNHTRFMEHAVVLRYSTRTTQLHHKKKPTTTDKPQHHQCRTMGKRDHVHTHLDKIKRKKPTNPVSQSRRACTTWELLQGDAQHETAVALLTPLPATAHSASATASTHGRAPVPPASTTCQAPRCGAACTPTPGCATPGHHIEQRGLPTCMMRAPPLPCAWRQ